MKRQELIDFATWLDEGTDYFGKNYIEAKTDEYLRLHAAKSDFVGRDEADASNIEEARKIWQDKNRPTRKLDAVKYLMSKGWGLKNAHEYCTLNF